MTDRNNRYDVAVKEILSQLSRDDAVVEEVRSIALRGLSRNRDGGGNGNPKERPASNVSEQAPSRGAKREESGGAPGRGGGASRAREKSASARQIKVSKDTSNQHRAAEAAEELAFDVSRDSETYRNIFSTVQWYRDSFLIGSSYADRRSAERAAERSSDQDGRALQGIGIGGVISMGNERNIPKSDPETAMGHPLLLSAAEGYLRSMSAVDLLRPYATWLASSGGPMFPVASRSMAQSIPLAQESCDWAMRENMLWVLKDQEWRDFAKSITTEWIHR